ncbi:MAG TPA: hypothetical protein VIG04_10065 [Gemmatimonadales bacterium]|jgi:hypothetical protein
MSTLLVNLRYLALAMVLTGLPALTGCKPKDSPLRVYIRDSLEPYLDSLAYQLCEVKYKVAPEAPGRIVCPGPPEGYKKPPGNGTP